jgi:hypothetical protein
LHADQGLDRQEQRLAAEDERSDAVSDLIGTILAKYGLPTLLALGAGYAWYHETARAAEERKTLFEIQADYLMDIRMRLAGCKPVPIEPVKP